MRIKSLFLAFCLVVSLSVSSCYGPFRLTTKLHAWNGEIGDKWINELVFFALAVIPVYGLCVLGDVLIFNSIEFWSGNNPVSMKEGEVKEEFVSTPDGLYKVTTKKNKYKIECIEGKHVGEVGILLFDEESQTWSFKENGKTRKLVKLLGDEAKVEVFLPNGDSKTFENSTDGVTQAEALKYQLQY
ncbi:DUF3332 domain-containing protein [Sediminitomix flava]|uniref:Uncharacterized protein DUF3332 n=1 Tax=Sediminitomix flava TaxID=379075 RepID=A0A315ZHY4_SEDFL|nr:DUF3332 domain-containing protein [Sediminitomix flava]PWJ44843.1 uncharacterized protein DUF3332 [Sediminitomix flava]